MAIDPNGIYGSFGLPWCFRNVFNAIVMQEIIVILILAAATFYLGREFYLRFFSKETKCDGCAVGKMAQVKAKSEDD